MKPQGIQEWTDTGTRRYSFCPEHGQRSIDFLGVGDDGWLFRCKDNGKHDVHTFAAEPDPKAPHTPEEALAWETAQKAAHVI